MRRHRQGPCLILVDDRAGSGPRTVTRCSKSGAKSSTHYPGLTDYPPLSDPHLCQLTRLDSADVCFSGNGPAGSVLVGVEVKSVSDLLSSCANGRLQATQAPAMLSTYDYSYLLYYSPYRCNPEDGTLQVQTRGTSRGNGHGSGFWTPYRLGKRTVPYGYLESFLLTLSALGFRIKHVPSLEQAASWLGCLYRWWSKPWSDHKGLRTFDNSANLSLMPGMDDATYLRAKVAASMPGVGYERALAAAKHFPSIRALVNAGPDEWAKVPGIGKVVAKAVQAALE